MRLKLGEFCRERRVSLSQLAAWTGIARVSLSRYVHGNQDMTLGQLFKIVRVTGCSLGDLVDDREDLESPDWKRRLAKVSKASYQKKDKSWVPRVMAGTRIQTSHRIHG